MEKSKLENIGDVQLFFLIKNLLLEYDYTLETLIKDREIMEDSSFLDSCDNACKIVGIDSEFPIDANYLAAIIRLNSDMDFDSNRPSSKFIRPEAHEYSFDIDEHRTEYVRRTYKHYLTSYSKDLVLTTAESMDSEGSLEYYEGEEIDVDYYDGETTEVRFDKDSVRLIK